MRCRPGAGRPTRRDGGRSVWSWRPSRATRDHGVAALELWAGGDAWALSATTCIHVRGPDLPQRMQPARSHSDAELLASALGARGRDTVYKERCARGGAGGGPAMSRDATARSSCIATPTRWRARAPSIFVSVVTGVLADHGLARVALAGGSTPKRDLQAAGVAAYRDRVDWTRVEIFFGDERCVPPDHADSNYRMARETLLDHVPLAADHVHRIARRATAGGGGRRLRALLRPLGDAAAARPGPARHGPRRPHRVAVSGHARRSTRRARWRRRSTCRSSTSGA